jgi:hypothetical protein
LRRTRLGAALPIAALAGLAGCGDAPQRNMTAEEVAGELAGMRIEPGLWEVGSEVIDVRAPDLPRQLRNRMVGPRTRLRHCITPEQAARPDANFLAARRGNGCAYRGFSVRDGRIEGAMTCPDANATMAGRYGPNGYEMRMVMESPVPGGGVMTFEIRARGRRIGACQGGNG